MPDRESVIKGIQECDLNGGRIGNCPYKGILLLLKEQEQQIWELQDQVEYLADKLKGQRAVELCDRCGRYRLESGRKQ